MADVYLRSTDGDDADDGSTWALADATLVASLVAAGAGGKSYVSDAHAETQASNMNIVSSGTAASPTKILCGDDVAEPPTTATTSATITTTGANHMAFTGFAYVQGITFNMATGSANDAIKWTDSAPWGWTYEDCALNIVSTHSSAGFQVGNVGNNTEDDQALRFINTDISFGSTSQGFIWTTCKFEWHGGSVTGTAPTTLFLADSSGGTGDVTLIGVDLSGFGTSKNLVDVSATAGKRTIYKFIECKLGASVTIATGDVAGPGGPEIECINCDSADTAYRWYKKACGGESLTETTIVMTGGATVNSVAVSRKVVTTATSSDVFPFYGQWHQFWNDTLTSQTLTVEIVSDNVTFDDDEVWVELHYLGTSGFPIATLLTDRVADFLTTPANQASSSQAWTTTGLTTPNKQALAVTFTAAEAGLIMWRVAAAKPSSTFYYDPDTVLT